MMTREYSRAGTSSTSRPRRGPSRPALERLEDRTLLSPFTVGGDPSVDPSDFRITTFVGGLNDPDAMMRLSDGSLLVGVGNSSGDLLRFTDTNGDGVADNAAGQALYHGLPGQVTELRQAGEFILATTDRGNYAQISVLRVGAAPSDPLSLVGSINLSFASGWWHTSYASAVRPTPGRLGDYDVIFNVGSQYNGVVLDAHGNLDSYQPTINSVTAGGLIGGTLQGDSIYMVTLHDNNGSPVVSNLTRIASGLRNAASMAIDPATGDLLFADNGIDGKDGGNEAWSTDELDRIPAAQIGGTIEFFGFPEQVNGQLTPTVSYVKTIDKPGDPVTVVNPTVGVQPLIAFEPLPDPVLTAEGSESEGASGFALSPAQFPAGLNHGVFVGFHGIWNQGGTANDENPLVFADPSTGHYFDFVSNNEPGVGHFDGALSTSDSLFLADIASGGNMGSGAGQGVIYQIKAITSPSPTPTPTPTPPPNQAPVLSAIADQTVDEGVKLTVPVTASDPDGDAIAYGLAPGAPSGAAIDRNTGLLTWIPDPYASSGSYSITVVATDNGSPPLSDSDSFTVAVRPVNHPPNLSQIPAQVAEQGQPTEVRVARYASDPDRPAQALTYGLAPGAPSGAILDPASGLFAWTVPSNQPLDAYPIGVTATDNGSPPLGASETFTIDVVPFNHPPVVAAISAQTLDEGSPLTVAVTATDPDPGQTITYSLGAGAPSGAAIDAKTGAFTWTSDPYAGAGNDSITIVATDNGPIPKSGSTTFAVDVLAVNHPPVVPAAIPVQIAAPGQTLRFAVAGFASDPDRPAQTLRYSLAPGDPPGAALDPASGVFTWTLPASQHIGSYSFGVVATDNGSPPLSGMASFVVDVVDNGPATTVARAKVSTKRGLSITLRFSQPLDSSTAGNPGDFLLVPAGKRKAPPPASIPLAVSYDPATSTVTLTAQARIKRGQALRLTVIGSGPDGIAKVTGVPLAGDGRHPGINYMATIKGRSITHTNAARGGTRGKARSSEAISRHVPAATRARRGASMAHPAGPPSPASRAFEKA
jgi:hypothetical protein